MEARDIALARYGTRARLEFGLPLAHELDEAGVCAKEAWTCRLLVGECVIATGIAATIDGALDSLLQVIR